MNKYAIINENGVCCGIAITSGTIDNDKYILIDYSFDPTNKRWNGSDWEDYTPPEPPAPEPTQLDRIEAAANMKNTDIAQSAIDEYTLELVKEGVL